MAPDAEAALRDLLRSLAGTLTVPQPARHADDDLYFAAALDRAAAVRRVLAGLADEQFTESNLSRWADWARAEVRPVSYQTAQDGGR